MLNFLSKHFFLILKGAAMGGANVIPGVSGGTIAFITGIYEELINTLKSFNFKALKLLLKLNFKELHRHLNLNFALSIGIGIAISVFSIAKLLEFLFENHPILISSYFFGLILASIYYVGKFVERWNFFSLTSLIIGFIIALVVAFIPPSLPVEQQDIHPIVVVFYGIIGSTGMLLPGFSGSYILLVIGVYELIIKALNDMFNTMQDFLFMIYFLSGTIIGLVIFSFILSWILKRYKNITIALLTGFVAGSLLTIWPWKIETGSTFIREIPEISFDLTYPFLSIFLGLITITLFEKIASFKKK